MKATLMAAGIGLAGLIAGLAAMADPSAAAGEAVALAPHRAVYDMGLHQSRSASGVSALKGRMVYELTGSACEGWTQNMRFVTEMASADGQASLSDLRSTTFEDGTARTFRFNSSQLRDQKTTESTQGDAVRTGEAVKVDLVKPAKKALTFSTRVYFPVEHTIAMLAAARAGRDRLRADLYDGSEKGEKLYDTVATIGREARRGINRTLPAAREAGRLDDVPAWPVTITYYEQGQDQQDATPVYELAFLMFDNGVSRRLFIDYGDFSIRGELTEIAFLEPGKCEAKR